MVYRMGMTILQRRPSIRVRAAVAEFGLLWPPVRGGGFLLLLRSRGGLGRVRATPGASATANAGMDGPDGRTDGFKRDRLGVKTVAFAPLNL